MKKMLVVLAVIICAVIFSGCASRKTEEQSMLEMCYAVIGVDYAKEIKETVLEESMLNETILWENVLTETWN